jgi:PAS domain S-box-containing protein
MSGETNGGRERAYQALRESEELHRATLSNISDAVFLTDDDGAFTFICPNVDVIFGHAPDEVQAMGRIARLLGDDLYDRADLAAKGEIRNVEREVTSKSGERRSVLIHLKRVSIQSATVLYTCRDITELKHAEKELAATRLELTHAARLALVGELTASVVHEIEQPLAAILTNAGAGMRLTKNGAEHPERMELHETFSDIHDESSNAAQIIERLRTLVRKRPLELRPLDVNEVAGDVVRLVAADAHRRRVTIRAELVPGLPEIAADRVSLQQVILNLILNAMDAMDPVAAAERRIVVCTRHAETGVEVAVSDTGRGIAPDDLPKLFDAFFTTKKDGLGLGLAIARSIVEAHSGRIWAEDNAGPGATFRIALPAGPETSR